MYSWCERARERASTLTTGSGLCPLRAIEGLPESDRRHSLKRQGMNSCRIYIAGILHTSCSIADYCHTVWVGTEQGRPTVRVEGAKPMH